MFNKIIYDYARKSKDLKVVETKEYKRGYLELRLQEIKGAPFACIVAGINENTGKFHIGISVCNTTFDKFSKQFGRVEAIDRLNWLEDEFRLFLLYRMPKKVLPNLVTFYARCLKYYQGVKPAYDAYRILDNTSMASTVLPCEGADICGSFCKGNSNTGGKNEER